MAANTDDIRASVSKDIAALQQEVSRLQKMISAQGAEAYYEVRGRAAARLMMKPCPGQRMLSPRSGPKASLPPTPPASIRPQRPLRWCLQAPSDSSPDTCFPAAHSPSHANGGAEHAIPTHKLVFYAPADPFFGRVRKCLCLTKTNF